MELQAFDPTLTAVVHAVRNHPGVRSRMRDPRPIPLEEHERWVRENLIDARRLALFVARLRGEPAGITLLRNFRGGTAEIGVLMVEPEHRRLAAYAAAHLTVYHAFEMLGLERLMSYVPLHNRHALAFNVRCGIVPTGGVTTDYHELALTLETYRSHPTHLRFRSRRPIIVLD